MFSRPHVAALPRGEGPWARAVAAASAAVEAGGGVVVDSPEEAEALIWTPVGIDPDEHGTALKDALQGFPHLRWVQLGSAGVDPCAQAGIFDHERVWTSAKGLYAQPVAEHALALTLACLRCVKRYSRAERWTGQAGRTLFDRNVTIFGAGGVARQLIGLLEPFDCRITVVRKRPDPIEGATQVRVLGWDQRDAPLPEADAVILALALTEETSHFFGQRQFEAMKAEACLVNVARGAHVVTDDLVAALTSQRIAAAGLDVTDPEFLPAGHRLWSLDRCLVTPHVASTMAMSIPLLIGRITANVRRFAAGEPALAGLVDPDLGY